MYPVLTLGRAVIPTAPLVYVIGIYASLSAIEWAAKRLQLPATRLYEQAANAVIAGFVGARLLFVVQNLSAFSAEPLAIIWPLTNGYSASGGVIIGTIAFWLLLRRAQLPLAQTLDAVIVGVLVAVAAASTADGLSHASLGAATTLPWGIVTANISRHPVAVYELLVSCVAFGVWWRMSRTAQPHGQLFLGTLGALSFGRFVTEAFRATVPTVGDGYRSVQLVTLIIVLATLYWFSRGAAAESPA